jgi:hypothetical protein
VELRKCHFETGIYRLSWMPSRFCGLLGGWCARPTPVT